VVSDPKTDWNSAKFGEMEGHPTDTTDFVTFALATVLGGRGLDRGEGKSDKVRGTLKMRDIKMQDWKIRYKKSWAGKCEKTQHGKRTDAL